MSDKLKRCAHCGGAGEREQWSHVDWDEWRIFCGRCGTSSDWYASPEQAIAAWNARADDAGELPTDDACAILRRNLYDVGDLGRAMGILEPNELVGGSGDRAYIFERLADLIERDYVRRDSIGDKDMDMSECVHMCPNEGTTADEPKIIQNAEKYKLADDSELKVITNAEKYKLDTREKLEADIRAWHRDTPFATKPSVQTLLGWLDRQAAITRAEVFEDGEFDCMTCGAKRELQERVDSLTAEVQAQQDDIAELTDERELYRENMIAQTKRVAELTAERDELKERVARFDSISNIDGIANLLVQFEDLTAERDQLQADLDACRMREKAAEDYDFREAAQRWERAFEDKSCEVVRLTAERDELKEQRRKAAMKIMRMEDERKRIDERMMEQAGKHQGYLQRIAELTAERDRLQKVVQVQAESFKGMERELKEANDTCNTPRGEESADDER